MKKGFTLVEIITVLAIMAIILTIGVYGMSGLREAKELETTRDTMVARIEQTKAESIAGKNGDAHSLKFDSDSYTYFIGESFDAGNSSNINISIPDNFQITSTLPDGILIFQRLDGIPVTSGSVTIQKIGNASVSKTITIGSQGEVSF